MIAVSECRNFEIIKPYWDKLWSNNPEGSIYQSADYCQVLWNHLMPYKLILCENPVFYVFVDNGEPMMILPLYKKWLKNEYVLFGYKSGCGYLDAVYDCRMCLEKMLECFHILWEKMGVKTIEIHHVKEKSLFGQYIMHHSSQCERTACVVIDLPDEFDTYSASLSKNTRQNIRTAYNRLRNDNREYEFRVYKSSELSQSLQMSLLQLYTERQMNHYKKAGGFLYQCFIRYIDIATLSKREFQSDEKNTFVLTIDGKIAAYYDAIYENESVVVPRLAINDEFGHYSPGIILIKESIQYFYQEKRIKHLDLTHGNEKYKLSMGGKVQYCVEGILNTKRKEFTV